MKRLSILLLSVVFAIVAIPSYLGNAQSLVYEFTCIGGTAATCADGTTSLHGYAGTTPPSFVSVAGWHTAGDGGDGRFYRLGSTAGTPSACVSYTGNGTVSQGQNTVTGVTTTPGTAGMTVGELVSGQGVAPGAEIASIISATSFTMTLPAIGNGNSTIGVAGDNGGTLILDNEFGATGKSCYQKTNYRGDPHEWGAVGDGVTPDDTALQNWLGAYGNLVLGATANAVPVAGFGPWEATIPASYVTNTPLSCPPNANLRAPANDSREVHSITPIVQIVAGSTFAVPDGTSATNPAAVLSAQALCRISGLSINAQVNSTAGSYNNYLDAVNVVGSGVVIDGHAILQHGFYNLYCTGGIEGGMQLKDSQFNQSWSDNVHVEQCSNVRMIGTFSRSPGLTIWATA